jgi:hypothetical protein
MKRFWMVMGIGACALSVHLNAAAGSLVSLQYDDGVAGGSQPLGNEALSRIRGGFETNSGLMISIGIQRTLVAEGQAVTSVVGAAAAPIVSGVDPAHTSSGMQTLTLVQNPFDNRQIQVNTTIDATVTAASVLHSLDLQAALRAISVSSLHH